MKLQKLFTLLFWNNWWHIFSSIALGWCRWVDWVAACLAAALQQVHGATSKQWYVQSSSLAQLSSAQPGSGTQKGTDSILWATAPAIHKSVFWIPSWTPTRLPPSQITWAGLRPVYPLLSLDSKWMSWISCTGESAKTRQYTDHYL
jgi:hypothetical protein